MRRRLRVGLVLLLGQGFGRGAQAVYTILMVRELTRAEYGNLAYLVAVAGIFVALGDLGFSRVMVRDVARSDRPVALAREMLRVRAGGVVVAALTFAIAGAVGILPGEASAGLAGAAFMLAEGLSYGYESLAVGAERPNRFAAVQAVGALGVAAAAVVVLGQDSVTPTTAMVGLAAASTAKLAAHAAAWGRRSVSLRPLRQLEAGRWLRDALPFLLLAALAALYYRVGVVIIHGVRGAAEAAPYAAGMRVFDAVVLVGGVGFATVSPALSRAHRDRPDELWGLWCRMVGGAALVIVPGMLVLALLAHPIAEALFGARYREEAGTVLICLAPGMTLAVLQNLSAAVVFMADERGAVVRLTAINSAALIAFVTVGAVWLGAPGAAGATSLAELLSFVSFAVLVRRRHGPGRRAAPLSPPV